MARRQRRQSQNIRYMREILDRLRDFEVDEVRLLCKRYIQRHGRPRDPRAPSAGRAPSRRMHRP